MISGKASSSSRWLWIVAVLFAYFGIRLLFFAVTISGDVPPDEITHFGLVKIFSKTLSLPGNSAETYEYGLVTNVPWLYYWLMGRLLPLNVFGVPELLFLRIFNVVLAFATVIFAWRTLLLLTKERLPQFLLLVAITNTLMFTFLSAAVSYDNLANLLAAMGIYYLCAFFKERKGRSLFFSWFCQLAGMLTKTSLLPLVLILNVVLIVRECKNLQNLPKVVLERWRLRQWQDFVLVAMILVVLIMNIRLYGGNYIHYGKILPEIQEVLPFEAVMKNRIGARDLIFMQFRDGKISYAEAMELTASIKHEGDREAAIHLVQNYLSRRYSGEGLMNIWEYIVPWFKIMMMSVFGIIAHINMLNGGMTLMPLSALLGLAFFAILLKLRLRVAAGIPATIAVIAIFYIFFIMFFFNYKAYQYNETFVLTLQGRYLFPVIGSIYVLFSFYLLQLFKGEGLRLTVATIAALIFIASDFPFFLWHVTPEWYASP